MLASGGVGSPIRLMGELVMVVVVAAAMLQLVKLMKMNLLVIH